MGKRITKHISVKICYRNCEEEGNAYLIVGVCSGGDTDKVYDILQKFTSNPDNRFNTLTRHFIEELEKHGFEGKEMEFDLEVG